MGLFSNYCGPGGSGLPQHTVDAICEEHDADYTTIMKSGQDPYWHYNWADAKMLQKLEQVTSPNRREQIISFFATKLWNFKKQYSSSLENLPGIEYAEQTLTVYGENI